MSVDTDHRPQEGMIELPGSIREFAENQRIAEVQGMVDRTATHIRGLRDRRERAEKEGVKDSTPTDESIVTDLVGRVYRTRSRGNRYDEDLVRADAPAGAIDTFSALVEQRISEQVREEQEAKERAAQAPAGKGNRLGRLLKRIRRS